MKCGHDVLLGTGQRTRNGKCYARPRVVHWNCLKRSRSIRARPTPFLRPFSTTFARSFVNGLRGHERTPEDDGGIMVLRTPRSPVLDVTGEIVCDWRVGDVW
jgi:hypothetical protein